MKIIITKDQHNRLMETKTINESTNDIEKFKKDLKSKSQLPVQLLCTGFTELSSKEGFRPMQASKFRWQFYLSFHSRESAPPLPGLWWCRTELVVGRGCGGVVC